MACKYNMLIYRLHKLTFSCVYGMQIGLRSTVYQHIFSFPKQALPVQFVWNPESEALFLSFSTVQDNRNWVPDQKKFKQQKKMAMTEPRQYPCPTNYFSGPTGKTKRKVLGQKNEVWPTLDFPPWFSVFIWSMVGYSIISKSRLSS